MTEFTHKRGFSGHSTVLFNYLKNCHMEELHLLCKILRNKNRTNWHKAKGRFRFSITVPLTWREWESSNIK